MRFSYVFSVQSSLATAKFRAIKQEIRIVGVDDGVFIPHTKGFADVIGIVFRGGYWLDGVMKTEVAIDGMDATDRIGEMIKTSQHCAQLRVIMLDGVTFAGFNVVDIERLSTLTKLPVIAVTREKPDFSDIHRALMHLPESEARWKIIENMRELISVRSKRSKAPIYVQIAGISKEDAVRIVCETSTRSAVPEPLRVAHIIASGLTKTRAKA